MNMKFKKYNPVRYSISDPRNHSFPEGYKVGEPKKGKPIRGALAPRCGGLSEKNVRNLMPNLVYNQAS